MTAIDLGTYSIPTSGSPTPAVPSLEFDTPAFGYPEVLISGAGVGDWYNQFGLAINAVVINAHGRDASLSGNSSFNSGCGFDTTQSTTTIGRSTFVPVDQLSFVFNQSPTNAYGAQLILHLVNDARIISITP